MKAIIPLNLGGKWPSHPQIASFRGAMSMSDSTLGRQPYAVSAKIIFLLVLLLVFLNWKSFVKCPWQSYWMEVTVVFPKEKFYFQCIQAHSHNGLCRLVTVVEVSQAMPCLWHADTVSCLSDEHSTLLFPFCLSTPNCLEQWAASQLPFLSCKKESCFVSVGSFSHHELISRMVGHLLVLHKVCPVFKPPKVL